MFHLLVFLIIFLPLCIFTFCHITRSWLIIKSVLLLLRLRLLLLPPQPGHFPLEHLGLVVAPVVPDTPDLTSHISLAGISDGEGDVMSLRRLTDN